VRTVEDRRSNSTLATPPTLHSSVAKGLSSLKQLRQSQNLRKADHDLVADAAAELRQALRGSAELERELQELRRTLISSHAQARRSAARGEWASYGGGGGHSPHMRFAAVDGDTAQSLSVFGLGDRSIKSLAAALDVFGFNATKNVESGCFRSLLAVSDGVDGTAHSAASTRFSTFRNLPAVSGGGGASRHAARDSRRLASTRALGWYGESRLSATNTSVAPDAVTALAQ
jgi:hypothetical protein